LTLSLFIVLSLYPHVARRISAVNLITPYSSDWECLLLAESGPSESRIFTAPNVRFGEKQTFKDQAGIIVIPADEERAAI